MPYLFRLLLTVCLAALVWLAPSRAEAARLPKEAGLCGADGTSLHVRAQVQGCVPYEAPREAAGLCAKAAQTRVVATPISNAADEGFLTRVDVPCGPVAERAEHGTVRAKHHAPSAPDGEHRGSLDCMHVAPIVLAHAHSVTLPAPLSPAPPEHEGLSHVFGLERPPRA